MAWARRQLVIFTSWVACTTPAALGPPGLVARYTPPARWAAFLAPPTGKEVRQRKPGGSLDSKLAHIGSCPVPPTRRGAGAALTAPVLRPAGCT
jgi:hypothetical protein